MTGTVSDQTGDTRAVQHLQREIPTPPPSDGAPPPEVGTRVGTYMLRALTLPDVPVIQAVTITFVMIYVLLNLIVDISYGYLNPRVRTS